MFFIYPTFFVTVDKLDATNPDKEWYVLSVWSIVINLFALIVYIALARPTFTNVYTAAYERLNSRRPLWSKPFMLILI